MTINGSTNGFSTTTLLWRRQSNFQTKVQRKGHISSSIRQRSVGYIQLFCVQTVERVEPKGFWSFSISAQSIWYSVSQHTDWICCLTRHENSKGSSILLLLSSPTTFFFNCHTLTIRVENDCKVIPKKQNEQQSCIITIPVSLLIYLAFEKAVFG